MGKGYVSRSMDNIHGIETYEKDDETTKNTTKKTERPHINKYNAHMSGLRGQTIIGKFALPTPVFSPSHLVKVFSGSGCRPATQYNSRSILDLSSLSGGPGPTLLAQGTRPERKVVHSTVVLVRPSPNLPPPPQKIIYFSYSIPGRRER